MHPGAHLAAERALAVQLTAEWVLVLWVGEMPRARTRLRECEVARSALHVQLVVFKAGPRQCAVAPLVCVNEAAQVAIVAARGPCPGSGARRRKAGERVRSAQVRGALGLAGIDDAEQPRPAPGRAL